MPSRGSLRRGPAPESSRHVIQEITVVGNGDHGAAVAVQVFFRQATVSASRWLVGSSRADVRLFSSRRQRATRLLSPPESTLTGVSPSGQRRASMASSRREVQIPASRWSSFSCSTAWRSHAFQNRPSGSENLSVLPLNSAKGQRSWQPSSTTCRTGLFSSSFGSCSRLPYGITGDNAT